MLNKKIILINAISRGGSNILWNILQSHPLVCSPIGETRQVIHLKGPALHHLTRFLYLNFNNFFIKKIIDKRLYNYKLRTLYHIDNSYKFENVKYRVDEVTNSVLCTKSLNQDIYITSLFNEMYENIFNIGLVRNGYALCEGKIRRGGNPKKFGILYRKYIETMIEDSQKYKNYKIIKFEDILKDPFQRAEELYSYCKLNPTKLEKLRLKSKKILNGKGKHKEKFGIAGRKYWFDREKIKDIIDTNVTKNQSKKLTKIQKKLFDSEAKPILEYFGYFED